MNIILILEFFIFLQWLKNLIYNSKFPSDFLKIATESTKIKKTIILEDKQFRNHVRTLNLPSKRINELDDNILEIFFKNPYNEDNKYRITKYVKKFYKKKYLEKFKLLSSKYHIYLKNKKISDIRIV